MLTRVLTLVLGQAACGLFFLLAGAGVASAGSFQVSSVRATLSASQPVGALTVHNTGTEPAVLQLEVLSWSQQEGKDIYTSTKEVLANPPIFTVPVGGSQIVRVGLRRAVDPQRELSYRLFLQEVPPPPKPDFNGLQVALRISIPVFVLPALAAQPVLRWQAARTPQGELKLSLANTGNAHIQISNFRLSLPGSAQPWVTRQAADYVLPGQSRDWLVPAHPANPAPPPGAVLSLFAKTDGADEQAEVVVAP